MDVNKLRRHAARADGNSVEESKKRRIEGETMFNQTRRRLELDARALPTPVAVVWRRPACGTAVEFQRTTPLLKEDLQRILPSANAGRPRAARLK
jgi:hypothetical protein